VKLKQLNSSSFIGESMKRKIFVLALLLLSVTVSGLIVVAFTPVSAQSPVQAAATALPGRPVSPHFPLPNALTKQLSGANSAVQPAYSTYMRLSDDTGTISIEVPAEWGDVATGSWKIQGKDIGVFIAAAPDLGNFYASRAEPGVFFGASHDLSGIFQAPNLTLTSNPAIVQRLIDAAGNQQGRCKDGGRFNYHDNFYSGNYTLGLNCLSGSQGEITLVTMPPSQQYITLLRIHVNSQADLDAATHIMDTFQVEDPRLSDDD
jgi:hypothetical protein